MFSLERLTAVRVFECQLVLHRPPFAKMYKDADKSLAWPTSRCILFDGENNSFDASLVIYEGWNFNSGNYLFTTDTK